MASVRYMALRLWAVLKKEVIEIRRDILTYLSLIMIPFLQIVLFGYIVNNDAHHLPTVVLSYDSSPITRSLIQGFKNTDYFDIKEVMHDKARAEDLLRTGEIVFVINIPQDFTRDYIRKDRPHLLIEGDGSDPVAVVNAFHAASVVASRSLEHDLKGPLAYLLPKEESFIVDTHAKYNPALLSTYHTLPSLLAILITATLVMLTAISISSEYEHGTMEVLLITPLRPLEVILGKIIPHVVLGYILLYLSLAMSYWLFHVPFYGSIFLLSLVSLPFFIANLGVGLAVSTMCKTQFQAANLSNTFILPAIILSGSMFPFYAMPLWAQKLGELLPITHYLRITINVMLKDAGFMQIWPDLWPILLFMTIIILISFRYYRKTLD